MHPHPARPPPPHPTRNTRHRKPSHNGRKLTLCAWDNPYQPHRNTEKRIPGSLRSGHTAHGETAARHSGPVPETVSNYLPASPTSAESPGRNENAEEAHASTAPPLHSRPDLQPAFRFAMEIQDKRTNMFQHRERSWSSWQHGPTAHFNAVQWLSWESRTCAVAFQQDRF